jgi:hypothetical protein
MRIGLLEMHEFCIEFFEGVKAETFLMESSGVADVITSCEWAWCRSSILLARLSVRIRRASVVSVGSGFSGAALQRCRCKNALSPL